MILSGLEIEKNLGTNIIIEPFNKKQLNPNSYNLRLHNELVVYDMDKCEFLEELVPVSFNPMVSKVERIRYLDMKNDNPTKTITIPEDGLILRPGVLYLGKTVEYTKTIPDENNPMQLVPMLDGRSSLGRLGINVHATAGFGDIGFAGHWTLEISCIHPVKIYPDIEIAQIYYYMVHGEYVPYKGKYQDSMDIRSSRMYQEFDQPHWD